MKLYTPTIILSAAVIMLGGFSVTAQAGTSGAHVNTNTHTNSTFKNDGRHHTNTNIHTQGDTRINGGASVESKETKAESRARTNTRLGNDSDFGIYSFNE